MKVYLLCDLRFQPCGILSFSSKLMMARNAFSRLLNVENTDSFHSPIVLLQDLHSRGMQSVEIFLKETQSSMLSRVQELNLINLPNNPLESSSHWEPKLIIGSDQILQSFLEQKRVVRNIVSALNGKYSKQQNLQVKLESEEVVRTLVEKIPDEILTQTTLRRKKVSFKVEAEELGADQETGSG